MTLEFTQNRSNLVYTAIVVLACAVFYILEWVNGRDLMPDLFVYYSAAKEWMLGGEPYGQAFGLSSGYFKYSPLAMLAFVPLSFLSYKIASSLFYWLVVVVFIELSLRLWKHSKSLYSSPSMVWVLAVVGVIVSGHLIRELHLGNINLILLFLCWLVFKAIQADKFSLAGLLLALVILFKPHFVILLPLLLLRGQLKTLLYCASAIIIGLFIPIIPEGWSGNVVLLEQWFATMQTHNVALSESVNTVYFQFARFGLPISETALVLMVLALTGGVFLWAMIRNGRLLQATSERRFYVEFFVLIALIPNLTHTDTEHFIWSLPIILLLVSFVGSTVNGKIKMLALALALFSFWLNSPDLLGKPAALWMAGSGFLGLTNLIVVTIALWIVDKNPSPQAAIE